MGGDCCRGRPARDRSSAGRDVERYYGFLAGAGPLTWGVLGVGIAIAARSFDHLSIVASTPASLSLASAGELARASFAAFKPSFAALESSSQAFFTSGFIFLAAA